MNRVADGRSSSPSEDPLKRTSAEFLLTDIEVAMTFLDVAETTHIAETVQRNHDNAGVTYDTVFGFLSTLTLTAEDRLVVENRLGVLKARLVAVGQQF